MTSYQIYIDSIKSAALSLGKKAVLKIIFTKLPFMSWGPLGLIAGYVVEKILTIFINGAETGIFFAYIDLRVNAQAQDFSSKALANAIAQKQGTEDEKIKAQKDLEDSFIKFVSLTH